MPTPTEASTSSSGTLQPRQAVARTGNPLRRARHHLPRCLHPLRLHRLDARRSRGSASARGEDAELVALKVDEAHPWHIVLADVGVSGAQSPQPGHLRSNRPSAESSRALKFSELAAVPETGWSTTRIRSDLPGRSPTPAHSWSPHDAPRACRTGRTVRPSRAPDPAVRATAPDRSGAGLRPGPWDRTRTRSRPLSRDRTRCPRCPASRCTTRRRHRQAVVARVPRRARPVVCTRPRVWRGALHPRARCRPARQDAADS